MRKKLNAGLLLFFVMLGCKSMEKSKKKITGPLVSYIYYPSGPEFPLGHAEVEIDGVSWTLLSDKSYGNKPLKKMIDKSTKNGWPFFRFVFEADSKDIKTMKKRIEKKEWNWNCSRGALTPLSDVNICKIPTPINISPLLSGIYLASGKKLGYNNVKDIEYYGNPSLKNSIEKMLIGSTTECVGVSSCLGVFFCLMWLTFLITKTMTR